MVGTQISAKITPIPHTLDLISDISVDLKNVRLFTYIKKHDHIL